MEGDQAKESGNEPGDGERLSREQRMELIAKIWLAVELGGQEVLDRMLLLIRHPITADEQEMLKAFRTLDPIAQAAMLEFVDLVEAGKESSATTAQ